jgi:hydrogenase expression/formation protein HypC
MCWKLPGRQRIVVIGMCLGSIERLASVREDGEARVGRTESGTELSLAFAPEAEAGSYVLVYAGCAVEVVDAAAAAETMALRAEAEAATQ